MPPRRQRRDPRPQKHRRLNSEKDEEGMTDSGATAALSGDGGKRKANDNKELISGILYFTNPKYVVDPPVTKQLDRAFANGHFPEGDNLGCRAPWVKLRANAKLSPSERPGVERIKGTVCLDVDPSEKQDPTVESSFNGRNRGRMVLRVSVIPSNLFKKAPVDLPWVLRACSFIRQPAKTHEGPLNTLFKGLTFYVGNTSKQHDEYSLIIRRCISEFGGTIAERWRAEVVTHLVSEPYFHNNLFNQATRAISSYHVLPQWLFSCIIFGRLLPESLFACPNPPLFGGSPFSSWSEEFNSPVAFCTSIRDFDPMLLFWTETASSNDGSSTRTNAGETAAERIQIQRSSSRFLAGETIWVWKALPASFMRALGARIKAAGGRMFDSRLEMFDSRLELVADATIVITDIRDTRAYAEAVRHNKRIGSIAWLIHILAKEHICDPRRHFSFYPPPRCTGPLLHKTIAIAANVFSPEKRKHIIKLIKVLGAKHNDFALSTYRPDYIVAAHGADLSRFSHLLHEGGGYKPCYLVNTLFLTSCLKYWTMLSPKEIKYGVKSKAEMEKDRVMMNGEGKDSTASTTMAEGDVVLSRKEFVNDEMLQPWTDTFARWKVHSSSPSFLARHVFS